MDDHTCRFVYCQQVFILIPDIKWDALRKNRLRQLDGHLDQDLVTNLNPITRLTRPAIDRDLPSLDQALGHCSTEVWYVVWHDFVETFATVLDDKD
jgi:hypothetical protein